MKYYDLFEDAAKKVRWTPSQLDKHNISVGEAAVVWVDVDKFDKAWSKDYAYLPNGGRDGQDGRIVGRYNRFGEWLKKGEPVEMPIVSLGPDYKRTHSVVFCNGRHRFSWLRDHGAEAIPVVTSIGDADDMRKMYGAVDQTTIVRESRIDELRGVRNDPGVQHFQDLMRDDDINKINKRLDKFKVFTKWLKDNGYSPLGNGCFGVVFTHETLNYVIKIFKNDPAYLKFVTLCLQRQNDPHLPKFRGKIISLDNHFAVRMEKLTAIEGKSLAGLVMYANRSRFESSDEFISDKTDTVSKQVRLYAIEHELSQLMKGFDCSKADMADRRNSLIEEKLALEAKLRWLNIDLAENFTELMTKQSGILKTVDFLRAHWTRSMDMHSGNVMERQDGTMVIIDPFAGGGCNNNA